MDSPRERLEALAEVAFEVLAREDHPSVTEELIRRFGEVLAAPDGAQEPDGWTLEYKDGSLRGEYSRGDAEWLLSNRVTANHHLTGRIVPYWQPARTYGDPITVDEETTDE